MKKRKRFFQRLTGWLTALTLLAGSAVGYYHYTLPDQFRVTAGTKLRLNQTGLSIIDTVNKEEITASALKSANQNYHAQLMLFDVIPIKTVSVKVVQEKLLVPCGTPFGIKMFTNGVMVVGVADIESAGKMINPAAVAGVKVGDIITAVNGKAVTQNSQVAKLIESSAGEPVKLSIKRNEEALTATLTPILSDVDGSYKGGLWVRDSTAGIGTVTFYDPSNGAFGGLGHGICDVDTNELMPLRSGDVISVTISGIVKGQKGRAGELHGYFNNDFPVGQLQANSEAGVYGTLNASPVPAQAIPLAAKQEVKTGAAQIYTTVDGTAPRPYGIEIESINYQDGTKTKNLVVKVTDPDLLGKTGGIVQGMSGSPIVQNGKLVGAVTHVFVNDPTRGYGILAENMLEISEKTSLESTEKAS
ncbi:SpoIVB peptidase [Faecalispora sporosphaeroides]|uniref:SpoIVB peptidase n=1 Tax=Faecalispora sporosphaeroides TaxID=1549 RepID=A0A928KPK2_9FIRM|nr:SpoIVB peptidase [Faecalispora sporosphaeroides]MBE6832403.1 SpoIVB peptidase [Faecalispora sporosphaeroides]